jgi:CPA1 family monovalent cation:H+ antiporter
MQKATDAGLATLDEHRDDGTPPDIVENLRRRVGQQTSAMWERLGPSESDLLTPSEHYRRLRLRMLQAERAEVLRIRDSGVLDQEVLQTVMSILDLEESMIDRLHEPADRLRPDDTLTSPEVGEHCEHLADAPETAVPDNPDRCQECLDEGLSWVHLRMCLTCGHIACCDSSVGQHASRHYERADHPVIRSFEPGEAWRWCYIDSQLG